MYIHYIDHIQRLTPANPSLDGKVVLNQVYSPDIGAIIESYIVRGKIPNSIEYFTMGLPVLVDIVKQVQPSILTGLYIEGLHWILDNVLSKIDVDQIYASFVELFPNIDSNSAPNIVVFYLRQNMKRIADFIVDKDLLIYCLEKWLADYPYPMAKNIFTLIEDSLKSLEHFEENLTSLEYKTLVYLITEYNLVIVNLPQYYLSPDYIEQCAHVLRNSTSFTQYSRHMDTPINYGLRNKCIDTPSWDIVEGMLNHLDDAPDLPNAYFYRGSSKFHEINLGFISKSVNLESALGFIKWENQSHNCCLTIYYYPGVSKHMYIKSVSKFPDEEEVLTYPGEQFQITKSYKWMFDLHNVITVYFAEFQKYIEESPEINTHIDQQLIPLFEELYKNMPKINNDSEIVIIQGSEVDIIGNVARKSIAYTELRNLVHNRIYTDSRIKISLSTIELKPGKYDIYTYINNNETLTNYEYTGGKYSLNKMLKLIFGSDSYTLLKDGQSIHIPQRILYMQDDFPKCK